MEDLIYVNLREEQIEIDSVWTYIHYVDRLSSSVEIRNWTWCTQFRNSVNDRVQHLEKNAEILADIIGGTNGESRWKRGVLNFVGEISKFLFSTLDEDDAEYYDKHIRQFERNSKNTTELLKQQVYVIKSTLSAVNGTLADMAYNDKLIRDGVADIQTYMNSLSSETAAKLTIF